MEVRYYKTASGRQPVKEFVESFRPPMQEEYFEAVRLLERGEMIPMPTSKPLTNVQRGLHELRFKDPSGLYRIFYYIKIKDAIYMLHGFKKKTQKTPQHELKVALRRLKEV